MCFEDLESSGTKGFKNVYIVAISLGRETETDTYMYTPSVKNMIHKNFCS